MLADGKQRLPVAGHSEGMPFDPVQHGGGQHDVVSVRPGGPAKARMTWPIGFSDTSSRWPR